MPYSQTTFDKQIVSWLKEHLSPSSLVLDVGPGVGKFARLLNGAFKNLEAVEIFEPYVERYNLRGIYNQVHVGDVREFDVGKYDFVLLGDVLEHLSVEDARKVLSKCKGALVQVPFMYPQGEIEDNPAEVHQQPDLTPSLVVARYPALRELFLDDKTGVYLLDGDGECGHAECGANVELPKKTGLVGLVVHAVGLPEERDRFMKSFAELGSITNKVEVALITSLDYPGKDMALFNPALAKNIGLRRLVGKCDGVVCVDADYILPPGLLELLFEPVLQPFHVWVQRRDISQEEAKSRAWGRWASLPLYQGGGVCRGSCNYLSSANWYKVGGWDERTYGWGGDDDILHGRIDRLGIQRRRLDSLPLMHISHTYRQWSGVAARGEQNLEWAKVEQPNYLEGAFHASRGI